jgi:heptosyltransferase-2
MIRTLVIAPNWVGDTVMALPVFEALAAADRRVAVLAKPHLHSLLELVPAVASRLAPAAEPSDTVEILKAALCHEAVILPNSFRSAWLARAAEIPWRWGYTGDFRALLLEPPVPRPRRLGAQVEDYGPLLDAMGIAPPASWVPRIVLPARLREEAAERLERGRAGRGALRVGFFAGAEWGPSKQWPRERFTELVGAVRRLRPAVVPVLVAGPKEVLLAVSIHEGSGRIAPVVGPDLDLAQLVAVLAELDVLVTNDSGPMHLAAAVGVPCVALFGPTDPRRTAPAGEGHTVFAPQRWCAPCFRRRCPLLHHGCMRDHGVDAVAAAVVATLDRR